MAISTVVISFLLPWAITLICSVIAVLGVKSQRKKRAKLTNNITQRGTGQVENLALPVFLCIFSFLICSIPVVMHTVQITVSTKLTHMFLSVKVIAISGVVASFFNIVGFSLDFYLSLATRPDFRKQVKANLCCRKNEAT